MAPLLTLDSYRADRPQRRGLRARRPCRPGADEPRQLRAAKLIVRTTLLHRARPRRSSRTSRRRPRARLSVPRIPALLIGLAMAALTLRPQVVGIGPLLPGVQDDYGVSHAVAGLLVTIPVLCMGLFAPPAPVLAHRIGAVRAVTVAVALVAFGGVLRVAVPSAGGLIALTIPIGIGMGLGNALMVVAVKERFADRPLLVTGVYAASIQAGRPSRPRPPCRSPTPRAPGASRRSSSAPARSSPLLAWMYLLARAAPTGREADLPHSRCALDRLAARAAVRADRPDLLRPHRVAARRVPGEGLERGDTGVLTSVMNLATVPAALPRVGRRASLSPAHRARRSRPR